MAIITLSNISFRYSENNEFKNFTIENLDLSIEKGEFISIMGPNGSGKSTLIKIIANILEPIQGKTHLFNKQYKNFKRNDFAKHVAFVPQNSGTNFPYSLYEIVMMGRSPYLNFMGMETKKDHELVMETLEILEIDHLKDKGINEVSGGEAQRSLIARAIVQQPEILLLDEPSTHLDIKHQLTIFQLLKEFNIQKKLTILLISHDLNLSYNYSSRVLMMKAGKILYDSSPKEILTEENIMDVFGVKSQIFFNDMRNKSFISFIA